MNYFSRKCINSTGDKTSAKAFRNSSRIKKFSMGCHIFYRKNIKVRIKVR